jgi:hypothetical protein
MERSSVSIEDFESDSFGLERGRGCCDRAIERPGTLTFNARRNAHDTRGANLAVWTSKQPVLDGPR